MAHGTHAHHTQESKQNYLVPWLTFALYLYDPTPTNFNLTVRQVRHQLLPAINSFTESLNFISQSYTYNHSLTNNEKRLSVSIKRK